MERKSAQKGARSADERSPDGSDHARRDGAHKHKSASKPFAKGGKGQGPRKGGSFKKERPDRPERDGWSPSVDARRETREERAMRRDSDRGEKAEKRPERGFGKRDGAGRDGARPHRSHSPRPQSNRLNRPIKSAKPDKPKGPAYTPPTRALEEGERIAKIMARAGLCSRRDAEAWIAAGRVSVNGKTLETPAVNIHPNDKVLVDGAPLPVRERTRLWLYHKPRGLVTTTSDPEGRSTVFEKLPEGLPRVITVGRLDINTEGLLLLTNDGGLARVLELPSTGWLRRYRVRAYGRVTQAQLDTLAEGIALEGVLYGSIDAQLEREVGDNVWITVALREGKNREVKKVLGHLGLDVNRLIRVSYGPFQLLELEEGVVSEVKSRVLRDQLGERLVAEAAADFEAPILTEAPKEEPKKPRKDERKSSGGAKGGFMSTKEGARAFADSKGGKKRFDRDGEERGDGGERQGRGRSRDERGERREPRESYNAIPYAERKPYDPSAPRRSSYAFREEGADGKKTAGRTARKVGGRPQKADLLDPNAKIMRPKSDGRGGKGKPGSRFDGDRSDGGRPGGGRPGGSRPGGGRPGGNRSGGNKFGGRPGGPKGRSGRD